MCMKQANVNYEDGTTWKGEKKRPKWQKLWVPRDDLEPWLILQGLNANNAKFNLLMFHQT